ncbi:ribonuclease domain-containing protein, partial [Asaia sp. HN128]|uniref:ribonuclease domain-containing protein n=1 Tax=Asaia sp. HN128 TaxID=3081234 RepID=UPI00301B4FB1
VSVSDIKTGTTLYGNVDLRPTIERIENGISHQHRNDGSIFKNKEQNLPVRPPGYYTEYVVPTPNFQGPGPQRIVVGKSGEMYYTPDHYQTFTKVRD